MPYLFAVMVVTVTVALAFLLPGLFSHASHSLLFLTGVLVVSARAGLGPSLFASFLSFLAFNFFFTEPRYTFKVASDGDVTTLTFFLLVSAISGNLASRMCEEMAEHRASLARISSLYDFSRRLASAMNGEEVLDALADQLALTRPGNIGTIRILITEGQNPPTERRRRGGDRHPAPEDLIAAWHQVGRGPLVRGDWIFHHLATDLEILGLVAMTGQTDPNWNESLRSLCDQAALALDRIRLAADLEQAKLISETEQLRSALLSSVSHDLRTPLASIIGSATSLLEYGDAFSVGDRRDLLATVAAEAQRLDRHIQNLLDLTRLSQGKLNLRRDWVDLYDIIASAITRLPDVLAGLRVEVQIPDDLPLLWVQGSLIEQTLINLLDNAARFSPAQGRIGIQAVRAGDEIWIEVSDQGPGIPEKERKAVFDMFYSVRRGDRDNRLGSGLGLAICRGMIVAHGGQILALAGPSGLGTQIRLSLPLTSPEAKP